jgi:hypothetical protein
MCAAYIATAESAEEPLATPSLSSSLPPPSTHAGEVTMKSIQRLTASALSALTLLAVPFAASAADEATDIAKPPVLETRDSYMIVTRPDLRKCAFPMCGGYFVKSVNKPTTRCVDGTQQKECHAAWLNTQALGWTPEQTEAFNASFGTGKALVRGYLEPAPGGLYTADQLTITEAWQAQGTRSPMGTFYGVKSTGIVCITAPCPSLAATKLNVIAPVVNPDLDLRLSGASEQAIQAGYEALGTGILTAGFILPVKYPPLEGRAARTGSKLYATEFYLPAKP